MLIALPLVLVTTLWVLAGLWALVRSLRLARAPVASPLPGITVLKPLCGRDPSLEENLATFFAQDYPAFELVFGVQDPDDPALEVVERLRARHPEVTCRVLRQGSSGAKNPKVQNLMGMTAVASHDLCLISDSNVSAPPTYLRELAAAIADPAVGLVTNVFAGVGEESLGAALENVQLNGFVASGTTLPNAMGNAAVVGKSMLFRRSVLERLGGLQSVAHVLAEDYVLGKMFQHAGYAVVVGPTVLRCHNGQQSLSRFFDRQKRWGMLRLRLSPLAHVLEPLASPFVMLPVAWIALGPWALAWSLSLLLLRDLGGWWLLRGRDRLYLPLLLGGLRDLTMLAAWIAVPFVKYVTWRGTRMRVGTGTLVFAPDRPEP